jgi:hypothetical protein
MLSMDVRKSALERAFDLARSGACENVGAIKKRLDHEGYASGQVEGPALTKQLNTLIEDVRK